MFRKTKKDKSCGVIPIFKEENGYKILLIQHSAGHWSFPKGHPENKETEVETAAREFQEETGIINFDIDETIAFDEKYYFMQDGVLIGKIVKYFPALVKNPHVTIQEDEVQDYAWLTHKEALAKISFKEGKKILKHIKSYMLEKYSNDFE